MKKRDDNDEKLKADFIAKKGVTICKGNTLVNDNSKYYTALEFLMLKNGLKGDIKGKKSGAIGTTQSRYLNSWTEEQAAKKEYLLDNGDIE